MHGRGGSRGSSTGGRGGGGDEGGGDAADILKGPRPMQPTEKPPDTYPTMPNFPAPRELTASERAIVDKSRFLAEHFRYSGYHILRDKKTKGVVRYSDRYRRIMGARDVFDEMGPPSSKIFPRELFSKVDTKRQSTAAVMADHYFQQFLSSDAESFNTTLQALVIPAPKPGATAASAIPDDVDEKEDDYDDEEGKEKKGDDDDDADVQDEVETLEEEEDELGGDYSQYNAHDEEEAGNDAFGDDGDGGGGDYD